MSCTDIFYFILITTVAGSVLSVIWYAAAILFEKIGYIDIAYKTGKFAVVVWIFPVVYFAMRMADRYAFWWKGYLFAPTPVIHIVSVVIALLWILGVVYMIISHIVARRRFMRIRCDAIPCKKKTLEIFERTKEKMGLEKKNISLCVSYEAFSSCVVGVVRPCVIIDSDRYTESEAEIIFEHELTHVLHRDILYRYMLVAAKILHFFNPLVWIFSRIFVKYSEMACDYEVVERYENLRTYYSTILSIAITGMNHNDMLSASLYEKGNSLKERIERVNKVCINKKRSKIMAALLAMMFVALSSLSVAGVADSIAITSVKAAAVTEVETEEVYDDVVAEYYEGADKVNDDIVVISDANSDSGISTCANSGEISWKVYAGVRRTTSSFWATSGQRITVSIETNPSKTVRAGIIQPDGSKRYILTSNGAYIFELTQTGYYQVYVQNDTTVSVQVTGYYGTFDSSSSD